jgi:hypothetical protein
LVFGILERNFSETLDGTSSEPTKPG